MNNCQKNKILDRFIFIIFLLMLLCLVLQVNTSNFRFNYINNFSTYKSYLIVLFFVAINGFLYLFFENPLIFRFSLLTEFIIIYTISICSLNNFSCVYFPIILFSCICSYNSRKITAYFLTGYLLSSFCYLAFIFIYAVRLGSLLNVMEYWYIVHFLISTALMLILTISFYNIKNNKYARRNHSTNTQNTKNTSLDEQNSNTENLINKRPDIKYLEIISIEAIDNNSSNNDHVNSNDKLDNNSNIANIHALDINSQEQVSSNYDITQDISYTIAIQNSKAIYNASSELKSNINTINNLTNELNSFTDDIKANITSTNELFSALKRVGFNITNAQQNMSCNLSSSKENTALLEDILYELENLSTMTIHLSNKVNMESNFTTINTDVINLLITEFHTYSNEINNAIIKMNSIFSKLNKNFYSCRDDLKESANLLTSHQLIITDIFKSLDTTNNNFNLILKDTSKLKSLITTSIIDAKHLVADASEMYNALGQFGKGSYSIFKLQSK